MNKNRYIKIISVCLILCIVGINLFATSSTKAVEISSISVALVENDNIVSIYEQDDKKIDILSNMLKEGETLEIGKKYRESLYAKNVGAIDEYIRVVIFKYFTDEEGNKIDVSPDYIKLSLANETEWIKDTTVSTDGRIVLYYKRIVNKENGVTPEFCREIEIDPRIYNLASEMEFIEEKRRRKNCNNIKKEIPIIEGKGRS